MLYVFFLPTFLQNSKKTSKIATKIAATVNEKNISKHDRMKKFSTGIRRKKKIMFTSFPSAVRKSVGNTFSGNPET